MRQGPEAGSPGGTFAAVSRLWALVPVVSPGPGLLTTIPRPQSVPSPPGGAGLPPGNLCASLHALPDLGVSSSARTRPPNPPCAHPGPGASEQGCRVIL